MFRTARLRHLIAALVGLCLLASACGSGGMLSESEEEGDAEVCGDIDLIRHADTDSAVVITMEGPIVAREDNRQVRIIVDASYRKLHILEGYDFDATPAFDRQWSNDIESYKEFIAALEFEGFSRCKQPAGDLQADGTGACPKNRRMVAQLFVDDIQQMRLWWADCDGGAGTLNGKVDTIQELFQAQVPGFDGFTDGIEF